MAFSPDGCTVATGRATLVDPASGTSRGVVKDRFAPCDDVAIDEPRRRLALAISGTAGEPLDVRTLPNPIGGMIPTATIPSLEPLAAPIPSALPPAKTRGWAVAWTPSGMLAVGCLDGSVRTADYAIDPAVHRALSSRSDGR